MSPILLYRDNWIRIVLFLSKPVDVVFVGFEFYSLKFICTVCFVVCKHIGSRCNGVLQMLKCSKIERLRY